MESGSVAEVTALLASWCERASEGMAAVEFDSELARQRVVADLRTRLTAAEIPFHEVTVPDTGSPFELVNKLIAELGGFPAGVVSISGFERALPLGVSDEEMLAAFNFQRERLAEAPLSQIWWLSPRVVDGFLRKAPDLYSWYTVRLHLTETVLPSPVSGMIEPWIFQDLEGTMPVPLEDARQRAAELAGRFRRALEDPSRPIGELARHLMEPAVRALREAGAEREAHELETDLRRHARAKGRPVVPAVFVSYNSADRGWAEWIVWQLEAARYEVVIQAWDFCPGSNFVLEMQRAAAETDRTVAVLSPSYLSAAFTHPEWAASFARDPEGKEHRLVPVRVEPCELKGLLGQIVYIDLVGLDEETARERLLAGLELGRARPTTPPPFPGKIRPEFPGIGPLFDPEIAAERLAAMLPDEIPEPGLLPPGSRMPLSRNPLFVGREEDLRTLARHLKAGETAFISQVETAAATGLGGVGKTQLACEFVYRYGRFFAGGVFWLSFADAATVPAEVAGCGRRLAGPEFDGWTLEQKVRWVKDAWQEPIVRLLIFDTCEEPALLERWRPSTGGCRVLVTSRRSSWDLAFGVQTLQVGTLPRAESMALLGRFRPDLEENAGLDEIAAELGELALALHLAGSFLKSYRHASVGQPAAYLEQLRKRDLLDHPSLQGQGSAVSPTGHERHVARTFALSYERLNKSEPVDGLAHSLMARAAFFAAGEPIPRSLLLATVGIGEAEEEELRGEDALARLVELGLLEEDAGGALKVHRLVAAFARRNADRKAQAAVEGTVSSEAYRLNMAGFPAPLLEWQVHLRTLTENAWLRDDELSARLSSNLGFHLETIGDLIGALPYLERAVAIHEKVLGVEHFDTATSLNNLGSLMLRQGDLTRARRYLDRVFSIFEKSLGAEHPDTARSMNNLGFILQRQGDSRGARRYYERALAIFEKTLGSENPDFASALTNLGFLLRSQGDLAGAQPYYEQALAIFEKVLGAEHPYTALSLNNLGELLRRQRQLSSALPYLERALAIREKVLGAEHPDTATTLNNLGLLLQDQGDLEGARRYYDRALVIQEKVLGAEHPDTATTLTNIGELLRIEGELKRARVYLERALATFETRLGPDHPDTKLVLKNLESLD